MLKPIRLAAVLFILTALLPATSSPSFLASAAPHALGTSPTLVAAATYSILAGSIVTNTGPTAVSGDLGVSPSIGVPPHVTGFPPGIVSPPGAIHDADAHAAAAQADNTIAFGFLDQPCDVTYAGVQDLTLISPLGPGVYCALGSFMLSGNLTLTGSGVWIFKSASTLITSPGSSVTGGDPCNVWWRVGSSATLDTTTTFIGNILALTSIGMNTGATLNGRALAQTGAVTMDANAISLVCAAAPNPSQIIVDKVTIPAGSDVNFDFGLTGGEPPINVPFSLTDAAAPFESANLYEGTYQVTETVPTDWELSASCTTDSATPDDATDDVTFDYANGAELPLASGETIRCTFTNTENPETGNIIIKKVTARPGATTLFPFDPSWRDSNFSLLDGQQNDSGPLVPGSYTVTELAPNYWELTDLVCVDPDGGSTVDLASATATIDLDAGETVSCTFTNTKYGRIVVVKEVGRNSKPWDPATMFEFDPSWSAGNFFLQNEQQFDTSYTLRPGNYTLTEVNLPVGWQLLQIGCTDPSGGTTTSLATKTANVGLATGETVRCKFLNIKK